jgi:hypothetical protein
LGFAVGIRTAVGTVVAIDAIAIATIVAQALSIRACHQDIDVGISRATAIRMMDIK